MDIKTVGERVRLATAIKALRQECYLAATLAARTPTRVKEKKIITPFYSLFKQYFFIATLQFGFSSKTKLINTSGFKT